jgi:hypothetical protein
MNGSGLSVVISHPEAALDIQLPMLAITVAVHITVNDACRNGFQGEVVVCAGPEDGFAAVLKFCSRVSKAHRLLSTPDELQVVRD